MKPVLILQNQTADGPAYLGTWLRRLGLPFEVFDAQQDEVFPESLEGHGALALLGGEMSANDDLPSLRQAERLFRQAVRDGVPTIGHCLGGQLMARALGAAVKASPAPEIGWQPLEVLQTHAAQHWFGQAGPRHVMHWHREAFDLPPGAELLARSDACPSQAFACGPHLALQFHLEIDAEKLSRWVRDEPHVAAPAGTAGTVQQPAAMLLAAPQHMAMHQALADRVYARWLGELTAAPFGHA